MAGNKKKKKIRVRVEHWFIPKEAHTIADKVRAQARAIRKQANALRKAKNTLDGSWEGNSKSNFMQKFDPTPGNLNSYASWLEQAAKKIETTQAMEYRWEWREV